MTLKEKANPVNIKTTYALGSSCAAWAALAPWGVAT